MLTAAVQLITVLAVLAYLRERDSRERVERQLLITRIQDPPAGIIQAVGEDVSPGFRNEWAAGEWPHVPVEELIAQETNGAS